MTRPLEQRCAMRQVQALGYIMWDNPPVGFKAGRGGEDPPNMKHCLGNLFLVNSKIARIRCYTILSTILSSGTHKQVSARNPRGDP